MQTPPPPLPTSRPAAALHTAFGALGGWVQAAALECLAAGLLWLVGLELLHVPWAPFWAFLAVLFQFIPSVGGMLSLAGPVMATALADQPDLVFRLSMVFGLYAVIVILLGVCIGPMLLHRTTLVPWWAALLGPIVFGAIIPPWGVLLAPPLLAVLFALFRMRSNSLTKSST